MMGVVVREEQVSEELESWHRAYLLILFVASFHFLICTHERLHGRKLSLERFDLLNYLNDECLCRPLNVKDL